MHLPLLCLLSVVVVPVPVQSRAHNLQVVHDVQRVRGLRLSLWLPRGSVRRLLIVGLLNQKAIEPAVSSGDHVAYFHLFGQWSQVEPDLLLLAVHVDVRVDFLLRLDVLLLDRLLVVLIDDLSGSTVDIDALQAAQDQNVVLLDREGVEVAELLWQSDLDEAPQVEIGVQPLNAVIEVSSGIRATPSEHIHVLFLERAAPRVDPLNIHRGVLAPRFGLHAERFHLLQASIVVIEAADDEHDHVLLRHLRRLRAVLLILVLVLLVGRR